MENSNIKEKIEMEIIGIYLNLKSANKRINKFKKNNAAQIDIDKAYRMHKDHVDHLSKLEYALDLFDYDGGMAMIMIKDFAISDQEELEFFEIGYKDQIERYRLEGN